MKIQLTSKQKIWEGNTEKQAENEKKKKEKKANKNKRWTRKKIQNKQLFLIIIEFHHPGLPFFSSPYRSLCQHHVIFSEPRNNLWWRIVERWEDTFLHQHRWKEMPELWPSM